MREALIDLVSKHTPFDGIEKDHTVNTLAFLRQNENCTSTSNLAGHITASAWVLSPIPSAVLLTHHKKLNRWLQLGGHIENDSTIHQAAHREAVEESGIDRINILDDSIFDIDIHEIPARKGISEHLHYDIRFLFQAESTEFIVSSESNELAWIKLTSIESLLPDDSMLRMWHKSKPYCANLEASQDLPSS
ncbi:MAG: NUDIX hydrolase [Granulosicoccus sp.]